MSETMMPRRIAAFMAAWIHGAIPTEKVSIEECYAFMDAHGIHGDDIWDLIGEGIRSVEEWAAARKEQTT